MSLTEWAQVELLLMLHQNQHAMNVKGWLNGLANINQTDFTKSSSTNPAHFWMWLQHCRKFSWQLKSLFTLPLWSMSVTKWAQVELLLMLHQNQHAMNVKGWLNGLANINQTGFTKSSSTNPAHFWMWLQHCRKFSWQLKPLFTLPLYVRLYFRVPSKLHEWNVVFKAEVRWETEIWLAKTIWVGMHFVYGAVLHRLSTLSLKETLCEATAIVHGGCLLPKCKLCGLAIPL